MVNEEELIEEEIAKAIELSPDNPRNYERLFGATEVHRQKGKQYLELRQAYSKRFIPPRSFWNDRISAEEQSDFVAIAEAYKEALALHPHISIAVQYVKVMTEAHEDGKLSDEEYRAQFETLLNAFGFDIFGSKEIWQAYIEFEVDEFEDAVQLASEDNQIKTLKERFIKLFHRQLSLPLAGNEDTLSWLESVLSEHCTEADTNIIKPEELNKKYTRAIEMRESRLTYEFHLLGDSYANSTAEDKAASWLSYIKFEIQDGQIGRAQRLFERSLLDESLRLYVPQWVEFLSFSFLTLKNWVVIEDVAGRTLKVLHEEFYRRQSTGNHYEMNVTPLKRLLWQLRLIALEKKKGASIDEINTEVGIAISGRFSQAEDYLNLLFFSCDFARRQLASREDKALSIQDVKDSFNYIEVYLSSYYPDWLDGWWRLYKYWSKVVDEDLKEAGNRIDEPNDGENEIWEKATERFPNSYFFWQENVNHLKSLRSYSRCSKVFKKLFNLKSLDVDRVEVVARDWLLFEQQYGELDSLIATWKVVFEAVKGSALASYSTAISPTNESSLEITSAVADLATSAVNRQGKRKLQQQQNLQSDSSELISSEERTSKKPKVTFASVESSESQPAVLEDAKEEKKSNIPHCQPFSVELRNLPFSATESEVSSHLKAHCGDDAIVNFRLLLSKTGTSRGIAHVQFADENAYNAALSLNESEFLARKLIVEELSAALAREAALAAKNKQEGIKKAKTAAAGSAPAPHLTTVYVSKLPLEATDDDLRSFFAPCGNILAAKVSLDKKIGRSKGFGFVQFDNEASKTAALALNEKELLGVQVSVTPSRYSLIAPTKPQVEASEDAVQSNNIPSLASTKASSKGAAFKPRVLVKSTKK